ncbi:MAG: archease [Methylocystis sp.]
MSNVDFSDFSRLRWEHFAHDADMGIRGFGPTPAKAFEQAALAMTAVVTDVGLVQLEKEIEIELEAPKLDLLFFRLDKRIGVRDGRQKNGLRRVPRGH